MNYYISEKFFDFDMQIKYLFKDFSY